MEQQETSIRVLIITTQNTINDRSISTALTRFSPEIVTSCTYTPPEPHVYGTAGGTSFILQERPQFIPNREAIRRLFTLHESDMSLCEMLLSWMQSARDPFESGSELFRIDAPVPLGVTFDIILNEVSVDHRVWAQKLLCWVATSLRPLRLEELFWLLRMLDAPQSSDGIQPTTSNLSDRWSYARNTIAHLHGVLKLEGGEVYFRHPGFRIWLLDEASTIYPGAWYHQNYEAERHELLLMTSLQYLTQSKSDEVGWFTYAIEFWIYHYKHAPGAVEMIVDEFFRSRTALGTWLDAYKQLPTPSMKPHRNTRSALAVAAHFGLQSAMSKYPAQDVTDWCQAVLEAARVGNCSVLDLLCRSPLYQFGLGDKALHDITIAASLCDNDEVFRKVVDLIPTPPESTITLNQCVREFEKSGQNVCKEKRDSSENDNTMGDITSGDVQSQEGVKDLENDATEKSKAKASLIWFDGPLLQASKLGLSDIVRKLLSIGANPNPENVSDSTPLQAAAANSHNDTSKLLIEAGAYIDATGSSGHTPLSLAKSADIVTTLLESGAQIDKRTGSSPALPIQVMAESGRYRALEAILNYEDYHKYYQEGSDRHPVNLASRFARKKCLDVLLRHGFNPNVADNDHHAALYHAILTGQITICKSLLENGADPNFAPSGVRPPLHLAIDKKRHDIMGLLLEYGADIELREGDAKKWDRTACEWHPPNIKSLPDILKYCSPSTGTRKPRSTF